MKKNVKKVIKELEIVLRNYTANGDLTTDMCLSIIKRFGYRVYLSLKGVKIKEVCDNLDIPDITIKMISNSGVYEYLF